MREPCWQTITQREAYSIFQKCPYHLFRNYNHRTGETEWFYEDEGLCKIFLVMAVDTPKAVFYYKNINVIK